MTDTEATPTGEGHDVQLWEPRRSLRRLSAAEAALTCGFLRCRPEKWFPAFSTYWMPVLHALGVEAKIGEIKPLLVKPPAQDITFVGSVSGESVIIALDTASAQTLSEELVPGAGDKAASVVFEYFVRRFISSLAVSWSGPESTTVTFQRGVDPSTVSVVGSIRVSFTVNTIPCTVWLGLGAKMIEMFDGLWRRQVQLMSKGVSGSPMLRLEIAQLGVPPQMLSDYLTKGTVIDLEVKASDSITVKIGNKPWMPGRLIDVGGMFGCEMSPGALAVPPVTEGATQVSVELGSMSIDAGRLAELGQGGSVLLTTFPVSESVQLVINQEKVADARLCIYEGRFAIEVQ